MPSWDSIPESERAFQLRLMEIYAGFCEHTDAQVGKLIDYLDQTGQRDNTIIFYIWGDNGSSAEGQNGSISELLAQNQIPNTIAQQIKALDELGGLKALGGPLTDNMYHAGWAWAGDTPFRYTKLVAVPLRRHAQSARRFVAEEDQAGQDAALAVLPRQRHRPDALRRPRHQAAEGRQRLRAGPDRRREHGGVLHQSPRRRRTSTSSISTTTAAAASTRMAGMPALSARSSRG